MTKLRLHLRLLRLARRAISASCGELDAIWSEAEAIHRDLGHRYNADLVLPQHQRRLG